jgi:hypothetical protein
MGIFSNIFRGRDAPVTDRTAGSSFSFLMDEVMGPYPLMPDRMNAIGMAI